MNRGEVWWALLEPRSGAEQQGRPVVLVAHQGFLDVPSWRSLVVVPVSTSTRQSRRGPTVVPLGEAPSGLSADSVALCHQVTTLDRSKIERYIGTLPEEAMSRLEAGLKAAMGLS